MNDGVRLGLSLREVSKGLGLSERHVWQLIRDGELPSIRFGRRIVVPTAALQAWLAERAAENARTQRERLGEGVEAQTDEAQTHNTEEAQ